MMSTTVFKHFAKLRRRESVKSSGLSSILSVYTSTTKEDGQNGVRHYGVTDDAVDSPFAVTQVTMG